MTTVFPCYAEADREFATELAEFLERGADVRVFLDEGAIGAGEDLIGKARDGRMADVVAVVLSPDSVPSKWVRREWEEAFLAGPAEEGVRIGFLLRSECRFPEVLRRHAFFTHPRGLKRWLRTETRLRTATPPELERLVVELADRPGIATSALANEFVEHCAADFDAVFRLHCGDRTLAQMAGDLGWQIGLRLDGEPLDNAERIRQFCHDRRFLIVLEAARTPEALELVGSGRTSTLLTETPVREYRPKGLEEIQETFARALAEDDWRGARALARRGVVLARERDRLAEALEIMQALFGSAKERGDRATIEEAGREQIWILEHWDRLQEADALRRELGVHHATQLAFAF